MRRSPRPRGNTVSPSLFPLLAVLICTMGSLVVLLVIVVQQAQAKPEEVAAAPAEARSAADHQQAAEDQRWRTEMLRTQRESLAAELEVQRQELSYYEDRIRDLEGRFADLKDQLKRIEDVRDGQQTDRDFLAEQLRQTELELAEARAALSRAMQAAASRPRSYAIATYEGPHGTRRRPIYIECAGTRILLQPEGVEIPLADMQGPLGPGNPLDSALRTAQAYLAQQLSLGEAMRPYPLLVVRPDGVTAYGYAREGMKSWEHEFGYELIEGGVELKYPPADAALAERLRQAVEQARRRQQLVIAQYKAQQALEGMGGRYLGGGAGEGGRFGIEQNLGDEVGDGFGGTATETTLGARERNGDSSSGPPSGDRRNYIGGGSPGSAPGGAPNSAEASMAQTRGANWGLPSSAKGGTGFTRPIRVLCELDRLVVVADAGSDRPSVEVPLGENTRAAVDPFVTAVWKHMDHWGVAGPGSYWKPVLQFEVAPEAQRRYEELKRLLDRSGLNLERAR